MGCLIPERLWWEDDANGGGVCGGGCCGGGGCGGW